MSQVKAGAAYVELTTRNSRFLRGLADAKRKLQDFGASARMLGRQIFTVGAGLATPMAASTAIFMSFDDAMRQVRAITQATDAEFAKLTVMGAGAALFVIGGALSALGIAVGGLGTLFSVVVGAIGLVGSLLGAILSPLGLVLAGIVGLGTYLVYSTDVGSQALAWLGKKFEDLKNTASKSFGAIGTLLAKGDIGGAAKILWLTLKMEWLKGTSTLRAYWIGFKDSILATTTAITYGMARIISDGWAGIEVAWTETIGFLADAWSLFAGTLTKTWHSTIGFIKKAWVRLKSMFSDDVDVEAEVKRIDNRQPIESESLASSTISQANYDGTRVATRLRFATTSNRETTAVLQD